MAAQTQGIQQLLAAEKKAAEKVSEARKRKKLKKSDSKARRLKQAKEEAQAEIEKYKQQREKEFKEFETKQMGNKDGIAAAIEHTTNTQIENMHRMVASNKDAVSKLLIDRVCTIKPELHRNYRPSG